MIRNLFSQIKAYQRRCFRRKANDLWQLLKQIHYEIGELRSDTEQRFVDLLSLMKRKQVFDQLEQIKLHTDHPIAIHSMDHLHPRGTKRDNTRHLRFRQACERYFNKRLRMLDLGCAGGGLVFDFIVGGHLAVGLEGSDFSLLRQRAQWPVIGEHLFTCDITKPFTITEKDGDKPLLFDVITSWEVLEHLSEPGLAQLFQSVRRHLAKEGLFCVSISTREEVEDGINWHPTVQPKTWWEEFARKHGFEIEPRLFHCEDFPRGSGNGLYDPHYGAQPEEGFHLVLRPNS